MTEGNKLLLAAAVAGGYVLGRTKKGRLALTAASYLVGRRLGVDPRSLVTQGAKKLAEIPQVADLGDQLRGELMTAGREAVSAAADRRLSALADSVRERTLRLESTGDERDEEEYASEEDEEEEEEDEEPEEDKKKSRSRSSRGSSGRSRSPAPKKSPSGRAGGGGAGKSSERKRGAAKKTAPSGKPPAKGKTTGRTAPRKKAASTGKKASSRTEHRR
ncbi:histone protein [Streptomyces sp. NPDC059605]|uniref:histone protein n=1 Tax=unclassified Streptomyces TaxID=2593676 RepID=UPI0036835049